MTKHMMPFHDHPLSFEEKGDIWCPLCGEDAGTGIRYHCSECDISVHKECVEHVLKTPYQCNHPLKIFRGTSYKDKSKNCRFCGKNHFRVSSFISARCKICNINVCRSCLLDPPPLTISQPKHHKHSLTLLSRLVTFTCNACGEEGDRNPHICLECNLMIHRHCADLPRVISINRHEHRISHTFHLGQEEGDWECGVCRKTIDWVYGAFICSRCPGYTVHSKCATRKEVWDGIELEDVPEEEEEIEDPFEVINETDIIHFSHDKHILRLDESCVSDMRCGGCILPINYDPCYKCVECDFSLHKECASLPRKKRHMVHIHNLTLAIDNKEDSVFECKACGTYSNGFRYECIRKGDYDHEDVMYDVRCCSVSEPFHHYLHLHPLYWTLEGSKRCHACDTEIDDPLRCTVCEYALCMKCATLPKKVKHRCDDHFLSLCHDPGNSSGDLWCDICETKTDPSVCYYTCDECGVSLHIKCVLGDLYYMKVGHLKVGHLDPILEVLANSGVTRPFCSFCEVRCKFPFLMKLTLENSVHYSCSIDCGVPIE